MLVLSFVFRSRPPNHSGRRFTRRRRRCQMSDSEQSASGRAGEGGRARCESGGGGEIEITRGASEAATYSVSEVLGPRVMGLLRVLLLHHSSLPSVLPSFLPGHPHSLTPSTDEVLFAIRSLTHSRNSDNTRGRTAARRRAVAPVQCLRKSTE